MLRAVRGRRLVGVFIAACCLLPLVQLWRPVPAAPATVPAAAPESLLFVVDFSGSMLRSDGAGSTRIEAAKQALSTIVESLPPSREVGVRAYGHRVPSSDKPAACQDTELIAPVGGLDGPELISTVTGLQALGESPIGLSLQQAAKDLPEKGPSTIILLSDGADECFPDLGPDPCQVTKDLVASGIDLRIETVGLQVEPAGRAQLECMAAGGGQFTSVRDAGQLADALTAARIRSSRTFEPRGEPVQGASALIDAPVLQPGTYTDSFVAGESLWFATDLERGSEVTARLTVRTAGVPSTAKVALEWQDLSARRVDITQLDRLPAGQGSTLAVSTGDVNGTRNSFGAVRDPGRYYLNVRSSGFPEGVEHAFVLELFADGRLASSPVVTPAPSATTSAAASSATDTTTPQALDLPAPPEPGDGAGPVLVVIVPLALLGAGYVLWRRKQKADEAPPPPAYYG